VRRREFLQTAGLGALVLWFHAGAQAAPLVAPRPGDYPADLNAYLRIGADGRVGCAVGKVELGQGIETSLAQLVAEELELGVDRIDVLMGDTDLCPWDRATGGSLTLWQFGPVLRGAAAQARAVLLDLAARKLQAPAGDLETKDGAVWVKGAPARRTSFGELVQGRRLERPLGPVQPKPLGACTVIGQSVPRKDALAKVTGAARYAGDLNLPGTLASCGPLPTDSPSRARTATARSGSRGCGWCGTAAWWRRSTSSRTWPAGPWSGSRPSGPAPSPRWTAGASTSTWWTAVRN